MKASRAALAVLAAGLASGAADAQSSRASLSRDERSAIAALQTAAGGPDRAAQDAALSAARAAAHAPAARYAVARLQYEIGRSRGDAQLQGQAVDEMVASGAAPADQMPSLLVNQATRFYAAGDFDRVDRLLARVVELQPGDAATVADYAQVKARLGRNQEAIALFERAIALARTSGTPGPESWYRRRLALAYDGRFAPQAFAAARDLVTAYPTPVNWRDALLIYRQLSQPPAPPRREGQGREQPAPQPTGDLALELDVRRLARAAEALTGERDYLDFAQAIGTSGSAGEAKAVLDEGVSRGMLDPNEAIVRAVMAAVDRRATPERAGLARARTQALAAATGAPARAAGDALFGTGQYAEAAELYRAALQKGGEDPGLVNTRLGASLALAGRRMEAETVFRTITGPRADLAGFWLAWLSRRPA